MCKDTNDGNSPSFQQVRLGDSLALVESFIEAGHKWHNHVLSPGCKFNTFKDQYALVIEDDTEGKAFIAPSAAFPEVDKTLVKMLHGDDILGEGAVTIDLEKLKQASPLLTRLVDLNGRGIKWHHHMNFPLCALNPHRGDWAITIESGEGIFSEKYPEEPRDVLRAIEVMYFANLARAG